MNKSLIAMAVLTAFTAGAAQVALVQGGLRGAWSFKQSSVDNLDDDVQSFTARLDHTAGDRVLFSIFLTDYLDMDAYPDTGHGGNVTVSLGNWRRRAPRFSPVRGHPCSGTDLKSVPVSLLKWGQGAGTGQGGQIEL